MCRNIADTSRFIALTGEDAYGAVQQCSARSLSLFFTDGLLTK